jgi:hypothetical protein
MDVPFLLLVDRAREASARWGSANTAGERS